LESQNAFCVINNMKLQLGDIVIYSLPLEGDKTGLIFTSIGNVIKLSTTHVTLGIAEGSKFPYTASQLPVVHRSDNFSAKVEKVGTFKVPILYVRRVLDPDRKFDVKVLEGVVSLNGTQMLTMWSDEEHDYVFRGLIFDFRGLQTHANPKIIANVDHAITAPIVFGEDEASAKPLPSDDPQYSFILKQCPKAVLLSRTNPKYEVPLSCEAWTPKEYREYIHHQIEVDLKDLEVEGQTTIKAVRHGDGGYYAFTEADIYIDARAFRGTVYYDPCLQRFNIAILGEDGRDANGNDEFARGPFFKEGHSVFLSGELKVSETKIMIGFFNMSLAVNNLLLLMREGLKHPLFKGDRQRALDLMITGDYKYKNVQALAEFYLNPLAPTQKAKVFRRRYLWWLTQ